MSTISACTDCRPLSEPVHVDICPASPTLCPLLNPTSLPSSPCLHFLPLELPQFVYVSVIVGLNCISEHLTEEVPVEPAILIGFWLSAFIQ